jgi:hypothetical protein
VIGVAEHRVHPGQPRDPADQHPRVVHVTPHDPELSPPARRPLARRSPARRPLADWSPARPSQVRPRPGQRARVPVRLVGQQENLQPEPRRGGQQSVCHRVGRLGRDKAESHVSST